MRARDVMVRAVVTTSPDTAVEAVSDGVVHFWGLVGSEDERRALRIVAENTPGVRGIEDHTEFATALPW